MDTRLELGRLLRGHGAMCTALGSAFYGARMDCMADDADAGGPIVTLIAPDARDPDSMYRLRVLGGVHRLVLAGDAPELARHYPTTEGDGDAAAAWPFVRALLEDPPPAVRDALTRPPQTNDVGRSASLIGGFLVLAREIGLPLRVLELGSSAGLNLRFERYRYEQDGSGFGNPDSPVRFTDLWPAGAPPFQADCHVAERRGCDRHPIDATTDEGRLSLLSYVWPDQTERFSLLAAALDIARDDPVRVDRAGITEWLQTQLAVPAPDRVTVVFHSIVWQYLTDDDRATVETTLRDAGEPARVDAPIAWLRLEPTPDLAYTELRVTTWPGGEERLLATAGFHVGPVTWLAGG
jgi:hypothetical protein